MTCLTRLPIKSVPAAIAVLALSALCACGGSTAPTVTARPIATASSTAAPSATPSPSSGAGTAETLELTADQLPAGAPTVTQVDDGLINNTPDTVGRVFANSDNSFRIEIDVLVYSSAQGATGDYPTMLRGAKVQVATMTNQTSLQLGQQADELVGMTSAGHSVVAITFRERSVLSAVFVATASGTVSPSYAESLALAQDQKITTKA